MDRVSANFETKSTPDTVGCDAIVLPLNPAQELAQTWLEHSDHDAGVGTLVVGH